VTGGGYQDVDKFLMLQVLGAAIAGPYTVAFRIASIFVMPVTALVSAGLPRLMTHAGTTHGTRTYRAVLFSGIGYGVLAGVAMLICAPWVPKIFGGGYTSITHYLLLLSPWPTLFAIRYSIATHLTAHDRQAKWILVEIGALVAISGLNLWLLPRLGPDAAVLSLLSIELLAILAMSLATPRRENRSSDVRNE
jgi:O-antigen/teichoic acid export membrane protein